MSFDDAFKATVGAEGGQKYTDNPADSGGPTYAGITQAVARSFGYQGPMNPIPWMIVKAIYRKNYWVALGLDTVNLYSAPLASKLFDFGVLAGQPTVGQFFQRTLNILSDGGNAYPVVATDGVIGSATLASFESYAKARGQEGASVMLAALDAWEGVRLMQDEESRPKDAQFVYGWLRARVASAG